MSSKEDEESEFPDFYEFACEVADTAVMQNYIKEEPKGLCTTAGRGLTLNLYVAPVKDNIRKCGGAGRGSIISAMKTSSKQTKTRSICNDSAPEIHHQHLRQATGSGYSNELIEETFGARASSESSNPLDTQSSDGQEEAAGGAVDSFESQTSDVDYLDMSDFGQSLLSVFTKKATSSEDSDSKGRGKKKKSRDRSFRKFCPDTSTVEKVSAMSEADRLRLPKKTITEIFREQPDYEKSYYSQKSDPFTLGSKNDFPVLK